MKGLDIRESPTWLLDIYRIWDVKKKHKMWSFLSLLFLFSFENKNTDSLSYIYSYNNNYYHYIIIIYRIRLTIKILIKCMYPPNDIFIKKNLLSLLYIDEHDCKLMTILL